MGKSRKRRGTGAVNQRRTPSTPGPQARGSAAERRDANQRVERANHASRFLLWSALVLSIATGLLTAFLIPIYLESAISSAAGTEEATQAVSLFSAQGLGAVFVVFIPAVLCLIPVLVPRRTRLVTAIVIAVALTIFSLMGGFSVGGFFAPTVFLLWEAVGVALLVPSERVSRMGTVGRLVATALLLSPVLFLLMGLLSGTFGATGWSWVVIALGLLLPALFAFEVPFIEYLIAFTGAALMLFGAFSGGLLTIAFWWFGGLWLVLGLTAIALTRSPGNQAA